MKNFIRQHKILAVCIPLIVLATIGILVGISQYNKSQDIKMFIEEGNRYLNDLDYEQAIASYQKALAIDEKHRGANLALGECYEVSGRTAYAEAIYETMIDNNKRDAEAYEKLGELYIRRDDAEKAKILMEEAIENAGSDGITALYELTHPSAPKADLAPGSYSERVRVELTAGAYDSIYYTLDGSDPNLGSRLYDEPVILVSGKNTLTCVAVNSSGFMSEPAVYEYTLNVENKKVTVTEPMIENIVRQTSDLSSNRDITEDEMSKVTSLYIIGDSYYSTDSNPVIRFEKDGYTIYGSRYNRSDRGMKSLADLKSMPYLDTVVIAYQKNLDISALAGMTGIRHLSLIGNDLDSKDLAVLSGLTGLEELCLGWNQIEDIAMLKDLTNLTTLSLWGNQISDISPVSGMKQLTYLDFSDNKVSDIGALKGLENLQELWMYQNSTAKLDALRPLDKLSVLMLRGNPVSDTDVIRDIYPRLSRIDVDLLGVLKKEADDSEK